MFFLLIVLFLVPSVAALGESTVTRRVPTIRAVRTEVPPVIDGILKDPCWEMAPQAKDFTRVEPTPGEKAREKTMVRVLYDSNNLYFGFICLESKMEGLTATLTARDSHLGLDDAVAVLIDSEHDHRSCYVFEVNPLGTQADLYIAEEGEVVDFSWDGLWWASGVVGKNGWSAEIAIPFNTLRFKLRKEMTWGVNFYRAEKPHPEQSVWIFTGDNVAKASEFGHLRGLKGIPGRSVLQIAPYLSARGEWTPAESVVSVPIGLDLGFRPLTTVQANITINPDYAEIEADQDSINLTRRELQLEERRPFFSEGAYYFETLYPLVYTRRAAELKYGAKAVGRFAGCNFAFLNVQAESVPWSDGEIHGNLSAIRVQRDVPHTSTMAVEAIDLESEEPDRTIALDGSFGLQNDIRVRAQVARNWSEDWGEGGWAGKVSGSRIGYVLSLWGELEDTEENFRVEPGFIQEEEIDRRGGCLGGIYDWWINKYGLKNISAGSHVLNLGEPLCSYYRNHTGLTVEENYQGWLGLLFRNQMWLGFGAQKLDKWEEEDEELYRNRYYKLSFTTDPEKWTGLILDYQQGPHYGSHLRYLSASLNLKPIWKVSLELSLGGERREWPAAPDSLLWIGVAKTRIQFTRGLFGRVFFQNRSQTGSQDLRSLRCLLGYQYQVRSAIYLAYNYDQEMKAHILQAKASYCLNL